MTARSYGAAVRFLMKLLLLLLLLLSRPALACINEYQPTMAGDYLSVDDANNPPLTPPTGHDLAAASYANERRLHQLDSLWHTQHRLTDYSDYGVMLVYLQRYAEARAVFETIEQRRPGLYATAANLGTVYELLGKNQLALRWIQRAVAINPHAHEGSEWIHVNILQAKLSGRTGAQALLGTHFGEAIRPVSALPGAELDAMRDALYYQLTERMSFVHPPDRIVGQLLFELGNLYALTSSVVTARQLYAEARRYGYQSSVLRQRDYYFTWLVYKDDTIQLLILGGLLGLLIAVPVRLIRQRRRRRAIRAATALS